MDRSKMIKKKIKENKGITGVDLTIAIAIFVILTPIVLLVFTNIYTSTQTAKRTSEATGYATKIIEATEKMYYDDLTEASLEEIKDELNIPVGYDVTISLSNYNKDDNTLSDLVKTIEVTITFKVGKQDEIVKMEKIKAKENLVTPNRPTISNGMVPVKYITTNSDTGEGYWQITSKDDPTWYSYENQKWANIMLMDGIEVDSGIRITDNNKESLAGTRITELGSMFVWIPRYSYKITYYTNSAKTTVQGYSEAKGFTNASHTTTTHTNAVTLYGDIDIKFLFSTSNDYIENGSTVSAETNGYIVHPAFKDGSKNDFANGEWDREIKGIWVAKFAAGYAGGNNDVTVQSTETTYSGTYTGTTNFYGTITSGTTEMNYPVFLPNTYAYNYINIRDAYNLSKNMTKDGNPYKLNNRADSHMIKNSEWGAIAYLTHSKYGLNSEKIYNNNVNLNNLVNTIYAVTGYAAATENETTNNLSPSAIVLEDRIEGELYTSYSWYTTKGQKASTTTNITGVYDLSGCAWEMLSSYIENIGGETSRVNYGGELLSETNLKYKKIYPYSTTGDSSITNWVKYRDLSVEKNGYGDAILETSIDGSGRTSWDNDDSYFLHTTLPFTMRGGAYSFATSDNSRAGIFSFNTCNGEAFGNRRI